MEESCIAHTCRKVPQAAIPDPHLHLRICRLSFGGSLIRPEATGYGLVYFVDCMLADVSVPFGGFAPPVCVCLCGSSVVAICSCFELHASASIQGRCVPRFVGATVQGLG